MLGRQQRTRQRTGEAAAVAAQGFGGEEVLHQTEEAGRNFSGGIMARRLNYCFCGLPARTGEHIGEWFVSIGVGMGVVS